MRLRTLAIGSAVVALWVASTAPGVAQSLAARSGGAIRVESLHADAVVEEGIARVEVDETFRNPTATADEGVYSFQLPQDAVIGSFSMWMAGKEKHGEVLEAQQARATYDAIVRRRKDPGLLEQTGWRDFRVDVFPIPPHDTVRVKLVYAHVVRDDLGLQTLEIPLPRGCGPIGDLRVHVAIAAKSGLVTVDSPSNHDAQLRVTASGGEATWSGDGVEPKGPFVVRSIGRRDGFDVTLLADRPADAAQGWFVAQIVPRLAAPPRIPRDVVFVIDRSGSMAGTKIEQARAALIAGLDTLQPCDRFDVVTFASDVTTLGSGRLLDATAANVEKGRRVARAITPTGGTNLEGALTAALATRGRDDARFSAIVFLTDGDPTVGETDPERLLASWRARCGSTRFFAFGVGDDVKDFLLTKLAAAGRGDARYVREDENLELPLAALFERVRTPLLLDPAVEIEGDGVEVLDREPQRLPDLFQGRSLSISGRFKGEGKLVMRLRGRCGADEVKVDVPLELPRATPPRPHVAQIWAKSRVERLLDDQRALGSNAELRAEVLRLGLTHRLVTPYTSFLVLEEGVKLARSAEPRAADLPSASEADARLVVDEGSVFDRTPDDTGVDGIAPSAFSGRRVGSGGGAAGMRPSTGGRAGVGMKQGVAPATTTSNACAAVRPLALVWLQKHQSPDGRWSADGFRAMCRSSQCDGVGEAGHDVEATGLALLAFLGGGETCESGSFRATTRNGLLYLRSVQDEEGRLGARDAPRSLRQHAIAGLALVEAHAATPNLEALKDPAQRAARFALQSRRRLRPDGGASTVDAKDRERAGGWTFDDGELDVETSAWMLLLLDSAVTAGLDVDRDAARAALDDVVAALEKLTDPATGRVVAPRRSDGAAASDETATAVSLIARLRAGRAIVDDPLLEKGADFLLANRPRSNADRGAIDLVSWLFGSIAMRLVGGLDWRNPYCQTWNDELKAAVLDREIDSSAADDLGSWEPVGRGAATLGRVGSTALEQTIVELYFRYPRVVGTR